ncbi:MAG: MarR family transcriptional regulator [Syntrophotaleaceae bacterium]
MSKKKRMSEIIESVGQALVNAKVQKLNKIGASEINLTQFQYISVINQNGDLSFTGLAEALNLSKPAVTSIVNKLIEQGYVYKRQSASDRRVYHIHLTEEGKQVANAYEQSRMEYVEGIHRSLTQSEFDQLLALMEKALQ